MKSLLSVSVAVFFACDSGGPSLPVCANGVLDPGEIAIDCGGACGQCPGDECTEPLSCASRNCLGGVCVVATCDDGIKNGAEYGVDCGGLCASCGGPSCTDGIQNQGESGVDCGGPCAPCGVVGSCADGIQNSGEISVDCGGPCGPCGTTPSCTDGIVNQGETGVDCGGPCGPCSLTPACSDQIRNQTETDVDCGGDCPPCADGRTCLTVSDCVGGACDQGVCGTPAGNNAPRVLSFSSNLNVVLPDSSLVISVVVTDPDGVEDLIGGTLRDGPDGPSYGSFVSAAQEGSYEMRLSWEEINAVRAITGSYDGQHHTQRRVFTAEFFDQAGSTVQSGLTLTFACGSEWAAVCGGVCQSLYEPARCFHCDHDCTDDYGTDAHIDDDSAIYASGALCISPTECGAAVVATQREAIYEGRTCAQICAEVGLACQNGMGTGCLLYDGMLSDHVGCYWWSTDDLGTPIQCGTAVPAGSGGTGGHSRYNALCACVQP